MQADYSGNAKVVLFSTENGGERVCEENEVVMMFHGFGRISQPDIIVGITHGECNTLSAAWDVYHGEIEQGVCCVRWKLCVM